VVNRSSIFNSDKIPYSIILLICIFAGLEFFTRIIFRPQVVSEDIYTKYSPKYDYGFDEDETLFYRSGDQLVLYPTPYLTFWRQKMDLQKSPDEFRVFTIGSSVSRGDDLNLNYSYYLEQYLNSEIHSKRFKVINCSATGIGSSRILLIFKKVLAYEPDLVIFHLHGSNEFEDERDLAEANRLKSSYEGIIRKSWLFCVFKKYMEKNVFEKFEQKAEIEPEAFAKWFVPGKREKWLQDLEDNTAKIINTAEEQQVPVIFVNRVFNVDSLEHYEDPESQVINSITKQHLKQNIFIIDTPDLFLSYFGPQIKKDSIFSDTVHWRPVAHQFIAKKIIGILEQNHIIEPLSFTHELTD